MPKKIILVLLLFFLFSARGFAFADLLINEIMYNPKGNDSGREWVEIYNTDPAVSVDLSKWYFFTDNTKHSLNPQSSPAIPALGYAIIVQDPVKFKGDWPNFPGLIFDSSWSDLNNTAGETIALKDPGFNLISTTTYHPFTSGKDDTNSLQLINNSWVGAAPTPGGLNQLPVIQPVIPAVPAKTAEETTTPTKVTVSKAKNQNKNLIPEKIPTENPIALATQNNTSDETSYTENGNNSGAAYIFIISFVFIGASAGAVYFIRRRKIVPKTGNDFEILDE